MIGTAIKAVPLSLFDTATLTANYQPMNPTGFPEPLIFMRMINNSGVAVTISYDGETDHEYISDNFIFELPSQTNSLPNAKVAMVPRGRIVYVKGTAGAGTISLSGYYL